MSSVFISGSIAIKKLPLCVEESIKKIKNKNIEILVGDAKGVDEKIQEYCQKISYYNVKVYSIYRTPRNKINTKFRTKYIIVQGKSNKERERQTEKDKAMTVDSDYSLVVWDGKSKGSYSNIIRAIENDKKIKIYLSTDENFILKKNINKKFIEFIYRKKNGYRAMEVVEQLRNNKNNIFKNTQSLNKWLLSNNIIKKEGKIYIPMNGYDHLLMEDKYRGRVIGVKFKNEFINWIEQKVKGINLPEQSSMF